MDEREILRILSEREAAGQPLAPHEQQHLAGLRQKFGGGGMAPPPVQPHPGAGMGGGSQPPTGGRMPTQIDLLRALALGRRAQDPRQQAAIVQQAGLDPGLSAGPVSPRAQASLAQMLMAGQVPGGEAMRAFEGTQAAPAMAAGRFAVPNPLLLQALQAQR